MTYYPDITQGQGEDNVRKAVFEFAEALGRQLSEDLLIKVTVEVPHVMSVPDQYKDIVDGQSHIALMKPVAYVLAHEANPHVVPACVAHRPIDGKVGTFYFAQVYAHTNLGFRTLEDVFRHGPGKLTIAYGDRFSTSNFLIPASFLKNAGIHPFLFFKSIIFSGGHDRAAEMVYSRQADLGAGHDGVIKILAQTSHDAEEKLVQLGRENIHSDPVVVNSRTLPDSVSVKAIQVACGKVAKTPIGQASLDLFWGWVKDLSPTEHGRYATIENALRRLGLTVEDML
jgi:ABC-type phosphate/phosphonate transport system substrate-binding protein